MVVEFGVRLGTGQFARERCVTVGTEVVNVRNLAQEILRGGLDRDRNLRQWRGVLSDWGIVRVATSHDSSLSELVWVGAMSSWSCLK